MIANMVTFARSRWILAPYIIAIVLLQSQVVGATPIPKGTSSRNLQADQPVSVMLHIAIDATGDNYPRVTSVLTAVVPTSWPEVQGMRAHGLDEEGYLSNYTALVSRF